MDGLKVHGRRGHLRIAGLGAGLVLVVGAWATMSAAPAGAETGCALAGSWFDSTEEVGSTTWVIKADGSAQQSGLGNATAKPGGATLSNDTLKIVWTTEEDEEGQPHGPDDDYAGVLEWKLKADCTGVGTLTFTKVAEGDPREGNVYRSTVTGPPPGSAGGEQGIKPKEGRFIGKTSQGKPISFSVNRDRTGARVQEVRFGLEADDSIDAPRKCDPFDRLTGSSPVRRGHVNFGDVPWTLTADFTSKTKAEGRLLYSPPGSETAQNCPKRLSFTVRLKE